MNQLKTPKQPIILLGICLSFFLTLFSAFYAGLLIKQLPITPDKVFYFSKLIFWVNLILIFFYSREFEKQELLIWVEKNYSPLSYVKLVGVTLLMLLVGSVIIGLTLKLLGFDPSSEKMVRILSSLQNNLFRMIFVCLTAGVTEELIFRGYLLPRLNLFFKKPWTAIIISSLLFGILHASYGTVSQVMVPVFMGFVLGFQYEKYRNIKIVIICHFLWDLTILLIKTQIS